MFWDPTPAGHADQLFIVYFTQPCSVHKYICGDAFDLSAGDTAEHAA